MTIVCNIHDSIPRNPFSSGYRKSKLGSPRIFSQIYHLSSTLILCPLASLWQKEQNSVLPVLLRIHRLLFLSGKHIQEE